MNTNHKFPQIITDKVPFAGVCRGLLGFHTGFLLVFFVRRYIKSGPRHNDWARRCHNDTTQWTSHIKWWQVPTISLSENMVEASFSFNALSKSNNMKMKMILMLATHIVQVGWCLMMFGDVSCSNVRCMFGLSFLAPDLTQGASVSRSREGRWGFRHGNLKSWVLQCFLNLVYVDLRSVDFLFYSIFVCLYMLSL